MSLPGTPRPGPPLFAVVTFWAFVLGGVVFAAVFVVNWQTLASRMAQQPPRAAGAPPPRVVTVGAGPVQVSVPVTIGSPAQVPLPSKPSDVTTGLANVVKTVLPDWQGTERVNILL